MPYSIRHAGKSRLPVAVIGGGGLGSIAAVWFEEVSTFHKQAFLRLEPRAEAPPPGDLKPTKTITYGPQRKGKGGKAKRW